MLRITTTSAQSPNELLAALPHQDYERIASNLVSVSIGPRVQFQEEGQAIQSVFFPCAGACSLVKTLGDGLSAEVATIGCEGVIGASVFFGERDSPADVIIHPPGMVAQRMAAGAFVKEMDRRGAFYNLVIRYSQALMSQMVQTTVCNGLHSAEQRCCRWLLTTQDRVGSDQIPLTHEFLAMMLGVTRPTVTLVIGTLQRNGLVAHRRGLTSLIDRAQLEAASCACYAAARTNFEKLLPQVEVGSFS
jgi:CRP-like cAMP-binding protein